MNTTPFSTLHFTATTGERALVLGGGGSAGNAWLIGVIAGLFDSGLDVTDADLIIGTSAGATAAAQITSETPAQLFANVLAEAHPPTGQVGSGGGRIAGGPAAHLDRMAGIISASADAADMRRRMGASALDMDAASDGSGSARWRTTVAARLPSQEWPQRSVLITGIDAGTGEPVVFDRHGGVELVDAVAVSTSGVLPYSIGDRHYLDGGYRRNENADLAVGYARVLVLSPLGGRTLHPMEWGMQLSAQVDELREGGSMVETILPDSASLAAFGDNMMNPATRPPAAQAGHRQGIALADQLIGFWR
jgi:NTE family protein